MKTFSKALGARCDECHVAGNFAAPTPRKAIAAGMWDHFVRGLATKDGAPVYCDLLPPGEKSPPLLGNRHDDDALGHWMQENYVVPAQAARRQGAQVCDLPRRAVRRAFPEGVGLGRGWFGAVRACFQMNLPGAFVPR